MAASKEKIISDENINVRCCLCANENSTNKVEKYCIECRDYFCSLCVGIHTKLSVMSGHKFLDEKAFKLLRHSPSSASCFTQTCPLHQPEKVTWYCEDHDEVACGPCIALYHRSCRNVISITEEISNLYKSTEFKEKQLKFSKITKLMKEIQAAKADRIQELKAVLIREIKSVKAFKQELQNLLDNLEHDTIQELRSEFNMLEASLQADITEAESVKISLNETVSELKRAQGNKVQEFICINLSQKIIAKGEEVEKMQEKKSDSVSFTPDQGIKTFLQQFKSLNGVSKPDNVVSKPDKGVSKTDNQTTCSPPVDHPYKVKQQRKINVKLENDLYLCKIGASCLTENGFLLLGDWNNKKLKRMDMSTETIKDSIEMLGKITAICTINKAEAAVAFGGRFVQFVSLGDEMTLTRTVQIQNTYQRMGKCHGLAHKDAKLFTSNGEMDVCIYKMDGELISHKSLKDIYQYDEHKTCKFKLENATVSANMERVFVCDKVSGDIIVLDTRGDFLTVFRCNKASDHPAHKALDNLAMCTDERNIFISNHCSNNIVQFGHAYEMLGEVGKVELPLSVCFDHHKKRLIATLDSNNNIAILELQ